MEFLLSWASRMGVSLRGSSSLLSIHVCKSDAATNKNASRTTQNAHFTMLNKQTPTSWKQDTLPMDATYGHAPMDTDPAQAWPT